MIVITFRERLDQAIAEDPRPLCKISLTAGYHPDYVGAIKNGRKVNPTLQFVEALSKTLGRDVAWMLGMEKQ